MRRVAGLVVLLAAVSLAGSTEPSEESRLYAEALELYQAEDAARAASLLESIRNDSSTAAPHNLLGWCRLRLGQYDLAESAFRDAARIGPDSAETQTGLGYVSLRLGRNDDALAAFERALEMDGANADAWKGAGVALGHKGNLAGAVEALTRASELNPDDPEARELLQRSLSRAEIAEERRPRPPVGADARLEVEVRARKGRFEVLRNDTWEPIFVKGVNLGTALPGLYPAEFPDDYALYRQWFDQIGDLGANVVRLYTLHPPSLYRALLAHNSERPEKSLWLVQGVWAVLPPDHDFDDPRYVESLHAEIRRVVDAVHGNLQLPARPGSAHGVYDIDVSGDLLAFILGREWEPYAVDRYQKKADGKRRFKGRYVRTGRVQPIEAWLASICEVAVTHETEHYGRQHPVAYASWPTLDPLRHPTESTALEEVVLQGGTVTPELRAREFYDEDRIDVDARAMRATDLFEAGVFASYHVYPYYPDFMLLEPGYAAARDGEGVSRYLGYLRALQRHHGGQPVLIAEFGVPTSRGISHLHPEGQHHGGHDESEQGKVDLRLLRDIRDAGMAGGIVFAWMDEWWKRNWMVSNRYAPPERNRLWLNVMDPEQNFGILAARPGAERPRIQLDGEDGDWIEVPDLYAPETGEAAVSPVRLHRLKVTQDEAYLYLMLETTVGGAPVDWSRTSIWVGIDTYDAAGGDHRFPPPAAITVPVGMEFLLQIDGPDEARLLIDPPYRIWSGEAERPCRSEENADGLFTEIEAVPNRERWGRDGKHYPARTYSRSPLRFGSTDPASPDHTTQADWYAGADGRFIEIRLPWGLLNVTDPSSHHVIHEESRITGTVEAVRTEGFRFHALLLHDAGEGTGVVDALPRAAAESADDYPLFQWPSWERPTYHLELKESYFLLQRHLDEF